MCRMSSLRSIIIKRLVAISAALLIVVLALTVGVQIHTEQALACSQAAIRFRQIEHLLTENQAALEATVAAYRDTSLNNAHAVAHILDHLPEMRTNTADLRRLSDELEIDEIHIFDQNGVIVAGTNPEYYGYSFDSGEQIGFFKPMLADKTLELCQDIVPNTAEGRYMQYSAVWSPAGEYILQVGMDPTAILEMTEKNELSYIFTLLGGTTGVSLYAIEPKSGEIVGASIDAHMGKNMADIGIRAERIRTDGGGFHAVVDGTRSWCVFKEFNGYLLARIVTADALYGDLQMKVLEIFFILLVVLMCTLFSISTFINHFVIKNIHRINDRLQRIADGNFDEKMDVHICREFSSFSTHINHMVLHLLSSTDKLSYILNRTNLRIGVYEYSPKMKGVRFTDFVPVLLGIGPDKTHELRADQARFREYIDSLRANPLPEDSSVLCIGDDRYIILDEIARNSETFGIIKDMTEEVRNRRRIEAERDTDLLTGLFNRRAMEKRLSELFAFPQKLGCAALVMIDADGLKEVNDLYGHEKGDLYLRAIAELFRTFPRENYLAARQGGDEFVLLLYGFESDAELQDSINALKYMQSHRAANLGDISVPLRFSFGYSLIRDTSDLACALKEADDRMYQQKKHRKETLLGDDRTLL